MGKDRRSVAATAFFRFLEVDLQAFGGYFLSISVDFEKNMQNFKKNICFGEKMGYNKVSTSQTAATHT